jgi:hypothetical protein
MPVIAFHAKPSPGVWSAAELDMLAGALGLEAGGHAWEIGLTERGDAQFYVLGPQPEQACAVCVSRIEGRYILEDGCGRLLFEHDSLRLVAAHAGNALRATRWWLVARIVVVWCTLRHIIHDRIEPLVSEPWITEGEELLVHLAPQLAAFA